MDFDGVIFKLYVTNNLNEMTSYMEFPLYEMLRTQDRWLLVFLYSYQNRCISLRELASRTP
jgi:alginate O-acetyltransferase complex protein AlgI